VRLGVWGGSRKSWHIHTRGPGDLGYEVAPELPGPENARGVVVSQRGLGEALVTVSLALYEALYNNAKLYPVV
jgi:hypothetical protein